MEQLALNFSSTSEQKMSSREIAELTGKRHDNVLRDCDVLNENYDKLHLLKIELMFSIRKLPNGGGTEDKYYLLTKIQTLDLMTGYNTELRIKVNRRWAELEAKQTKLPQSFSEALQLAADQAKQLELQAPKVAVYEQISNSETLLSLNDAAKSMGIGRNKMMAKLRDHGILRKNNTPYQHFIDSGFFEVKIKL
jgi:anti-repressor protein